MCKAGGEKQIFIFNSQYQRLASHRGKNRATMAVADSMAIAIFFILSDVKFNDLDADYYTQFNREKKINSHIGKLSKLGVVIPDAAIRKALEESQISLLNEIFPYPLNMIH